MKEIFDNPNERYSQKLIERFKEKIDTENKSVEDCWLWTGGIQSGGYGSFGTGFISPKTGKSTTALAHRIAYEIASGKKILKGLCVMHLCDNRLCCNPHHLKLGTIADNNHDMVITVF